MLLRASFSCSSRFSVAATKCSYSVRLRSSTKSSFSSALRRPKTTVPARNSNPIFSIRRRDFATSASASSPGVDPAVSAKPLRSKPKQGTLRKYINQFLLLVHPDYFHGQTECEMLNQDSLKKLNLLLDELNQLSNGSLTARLTIPRRTKIEFYLKPSHHRVKPSKISMQFELPDELFSEANGNIADRVQRAAHEQLRELLARAGVDAPWNDEPEPQAAPSGKPKKPSDAWYVQELKDAEQGLHEALAQYTQNVMDPDADADPNRQMLEYDLNLLADQNLHFDARLTTAQQKRAEAHFRGALQALNYHLWAQVPVMFTLDSYSDQKRGWVVIPWDFSLRELKLYLLNEIDRLRAEQDGNHVACSNIISLADQLCDQLPCVRVQVSLHVPAPDAAAAIERLLTSQYTPAKGLVWDPPMNLIIVIANVVSCQAKYYARTGETYWLIPPNVSAEQLCRFFDSEMRYQQAASLSGHYKTAHGNIGANLSTLLPGDHQFGATKQDAEQAEVYHALEPEFERQAAERASFAGNAQAERAAIRQGLLPQKDLVDQLKRDGYNMEHGLHSLRALRAEAERRLIQAHPDALVRSGKRSLAEVEQPASISQEQAGSLDYAVLLDSTKPLDVKQLRQYWAGSVHLEKLMTQMLRLQSQETRMPNPNPPKPPVDSSF